MFFTKAEARLICHIKANSLEHGVTEVMRIYPPPQKIITVGRKKYILINLTAKISVTHIAFLAKICSWPYRINVLSAKNHIVETW